MEFLYFLALCFAALGALRLFSYAFGLDFKLDEPTPAPEPLKPPVAPLLRRNFGKHHNPASLAVGECQSDFERLNLRTWQCPVCKLVRYQREDEKCPK